MSSFDDGTEPSGAAFDFSAKGQSDEALGDYSAELVASALRSQLERVLEVLGSLAAEPSALTGGDSATIARLAMRICGLYPQAAQPIQRVALNTRVLELYPRDVKLARERVRMTRRETALLHYLVAHRERVISRLELMEGVWGKCLGDTRGRTVDIHIHRLRSKLGSEFAERVETIRNVGYRFSSNPVTLSASRKKSRRCL